MQQEGNQLDGFPQSHIVGQNCPEPVTDHEIHPTGSPLLVRSQFASQAGRIDFRCPGTSSNELVEPPLEFNPVDSQPHHLFLRGQIESLHQGRVSVLPLCRPKSLNSLRLLRRQLEPLVLHPDERRLHADQPAKPFGGQRPSPEHNLPTESNGRRESPCSRIVLYRQNPNAPGESGPPPAPPARCNDADIAVLKCRCRLLEKGVGVMNREADHLGMLVPEAFGNGREHAGSQPEIVEQLLLRAPILVANQVPHAASLAPDLTGRDQFPGIVDRLQEEGQSPLVCALLWRPQPETGSESQCIRRLKQRLQPLFKCGSYPLGMGYRARGSSGERG